VAAATALISPRNRGGRSKKGPVALALAAGAAGFAVLKRRRSAAANEPKGQAFVDDQRERSPQPAVTGGRADEPRTGQAKDAESDPAKATRSTETNEELE